MNYLDLGQIRANYSTFDYAASYSESTAPKASIASTSFSVTEKLEYIDGMTRYAITNILIPLDILKGNSSFTAIVNHLKNNGLTYKQIAELLNRDQRTIWSTHNKSVSKHNSSIPVSDYVDYTPKQSNMTSTNSEYSEFIPASIFINRTLSVLESIVIYLKSEYGLSFNEIASRLGKNYRTIWTVYRRALKKLGNE